MFSFMSDKTILKFMENYCNILRTAFKAKNTPIIKITFEITSEIGEIIINLKKIPTIITTIPTVINT